ncbi:MAG TPA: aminomethyl-transferring glycine dehydrogenase subunit GcvPB [Fervidobacterium sp.]|nr:aminomethyl-transferring glycine dehydrogenase subunit GcvPB [Fervidobacterium sp.]HOM74689.1 aminomethyl-transferring glycine dehydrogenase subunit GcvPB [Fervidobacterium sp.]HOQ40302.1 aminomethyl-transferring glycine dehydrogenase subunit GcvPB [Fervidobacterium sp.]HPP18149.1 aminomethyl-transferring glycine dehydrogenase subunit GcvPB [Fervidobacterium sp.]HPT53475.1 aminomethyl-transferring glycine dehydrogenase subunit GcvPB [Fervidobacterium sp.]
MTIFEKSVKDRKGYELPPYELSDVGCNLPEHLIRKEAPLLPEVSEVDVVRHYTELAHKNYSVDRGFYPLGSCTMKYNPKINEDMAALFTNLHPFQPRETIQGAINLMGELKDLLCEITGTDDMTLQPAAGAHGELTGLLIARAYFEDKGELDKRRKVIVPDSAHGTNPASASMAGFDVIEIKSGDDGCVNLEELKAHLDDTVAVIMLTNPNTLGLFEKDILNISQMAHEVGAVLYYDGANLNAIMGRTRPGDMGFDIVHLNLHKTFSTPHGMGGPGSGPIGVKAHLTPFLPTPIVRKSADKYDLDYNLPKSIGMVRSFYGNFGVMVKAYTYIHTMGSCGLKHVSEMAVLNANYLRKRLSRLYKVAYDRVCMHEFVIDNEDFAKKTQVKTLDIAKRLLDYGLHAPTVYFPLIVHEAMMVEPTETESKQSLDTFADAMEKIYEEAIENPEVVKSAPHVTPVRRLDDLTATKSPIFRYKK